MLPQMSSQNKAAWYCPLQMISEGVLASIVMPFSWNLQRTVCKFAPWYPKTQ